MVAMHDSQTSSQMSRRVGGLELDSDPFDILKRILHHFGNNNGRSLAVALESALTPFLIGADELRLATCSKLEKDWLQMHYQSAFVHSAREILGRSITIAFVYDSHNQELGQGAFSFDCPKKWIDEGHAAKVPRVINSAPPALAPKKTAAVLNFAHPKPMVEAESSDGFLLDKRFSFDTFVSGSSNFLCYSASKTVVESPGEKYSPLFLFGPAGLGKTHLLQAIGLELKRKNPNYRILYVSAEQWVNAFISACRDKTFDAFRRKFRNNCDILLVDDVQFLAGKEACQDEFFHTFNALHNLRKQIVVTSDQYPHQIAGFASRLQTRLAWGLVADIKAPELDTRLAILHQKARELKFVLSHEVALSLAQQITRSVRELEGALIRLSAYASMGSGRVDLNFVKEHLKPLFHHDSEMVTSNRICDSVCEYFNLRLEDITGEGRQKQVVIARQVAMQLCRSHLSMSLPQIGKLFGGRSHSTVLSAVNRIENMRRTDIGTQSVFSRVEKILFS